jgi:hypothetical protein
VSLAAVRGGKLFIIAAGRSVLRHGVEAGGEG